MTYHEIVTSENQHLSLYQIAQYFQACILHTDSSYLKKKILNCF